MTHTHAVSWTRKILDLPKIEAELNANGLWHNDLGARPVRVTQVSDKPGELAYLAYYLFKPPYDVKMLEDRQRGPRLKSTEKGYKPEFAARLLEMLTQIELGELVRSSGEGKLVRREWHRRLSHWHRSREKWANGNLPSFYFDEFWDRYRNKKKKKEYQPFAILR